MDIHRVKELHDSILAEVKDAKYDTFARYQSRNDPFITTCLQKQANALSVKQTRQSVVADKVTKGSQPVATRSIDHYINKTSLYWREWKQENDMIEYLSENKLKSPIKKRRKFKRGVVPRDVRACALPKAENRVAAIPPFRGSTSVSDLMRVSTGLPTIHQLPYSDPESIGASKSVLLGSGIMSSSAPSRPKVQAPVGNTEPIFDADRYLRRNIGATFATSKRMPDTPLTASSNALSPPPRDDAGSSDRNSSGTKFSTLARNLGGVKDSAELPGPGTYVIPTFIDEAKRNKRGSSFAPPKLDPPNEYKPEEPNKFQTMRPSELSETFVFGFGCNMQEHIMYGYCLDGMCGKRAHFEKLMVDVNDKKRIVGDRLGRRKLELESELNEITNEINIARTSSVSSFPDELASAADNTSASLTPLHIAAHTGDLETIQKLASLDLDVNAVDSTHGRTAVHFATIRNNQEAVLLMSQLFRGRINLDKQDNNGDTALHIAVRAGDESLVEILCDAGASPISCQNKDGKWTTDLTRTHRTYQILYLADERLKAEKELQKLRKLRLKRGSHKDSFETEVSSIKVDKPLSFFGEFEQRKEEKPKFEEIKPHQLWDVRPNRSKVESLEEQLAKVGLSS